LAPFLRDEAETKKRKPTTKEKAKARETFGKIEGIGDVLSDGPRKFLGSQIYEKQDRLF